MSPDEQNRFDAILEERTGVLNLARRNRDGTALAVRTGRMTAEEKGYVDRAVFAFAEKIAIGFHVEVEMGAEMRAKIRGAVKAMTVDVSDEGDPK